jgi:hypothetical protein
MTERGTRGVPPKRAGGWCEPARGIGEALDELRRSERTDRPVADATAGRPTRVEPREH